MDKGWKGQGEGKNQRSNVRKTELYDRNGDDGILRNDRLDVFEMSSAARHPVTTRYIRIPTPTPSRKGCCARPFTPLRISRERKSVCYTYMFYI